MNVDFVYYNFEMNIIIVHKFIYNLLGNGFNNNTRTTYIYLLLQ